MTSREDAPPPIYIPTLHKELAAPGVVADALFMDPGLPQTEHAPGLYRPDTLPFSREKASRILAELLAIGETLDVSSPSGSRAARAGATLPAISPEEERELIRFSSAGETEEADISTNAHAVAAQKVLLLAWDLEERLLEIARLRHEIIRSATPLDESLHGPGTWEDPVLDVPGVAPGSSVSLLSALPEAMDESDWRLTVAAMAAFLPPNALLVTAHQGICDALAEGNFLSLPPETVAARLDGWPQQVLAAARWTKAPLWRILGHARAPENAPWLLAAPDIVVFLATGRG